MALTHVLFIPGVLNMFRHGQLEQDKRRARSILSKSHSNDLMEDPFQVEMQSLGFTSAARESIQNKINEVGFANAMELTCLARDFVDRPEAFSSLLISDFSFPPLLAHQTRAAAMAVLDETRTGSRNRHEQSVATKETKNGRENDRNGEAIANGKNNAMAPQAQASETSKSEKKPTFKSVIVNEAAQKRRRKSKIAEERHEYGEYSV